MIIHSSLLLLVTTLAGAPSSREHIQRRAAEHGFNPGAQKSLMYKGEEGSVVRLVAHSDPFRLEFAAPGRPVETLDLPEEIVQVDRVEPAAGDSIVLFGMVNGSVHEIVVVSTTERRIVDRFVCYSPSLSPDGTFLAFVKFYPPHFVPGVSDLVMVYDLAKGGAQNRPRVAGLDGWADVGSPVYPAGIQTHSPNDGLPESQINSVTSPFFWAADSSRFAFTARHAPWQAGVGRTASGKELSVILARREQKGRRWKTVSRTVATCGEGEGGCIGSANGIEFGKTALRVQFVSGAFPPIRVAYDQMRESRPPPGFVRGH